VRPVIHPALLALVLAACASSPAPPRATGAPWASADALFHQEPRWLGADAAYSIDLGGDRSLWLFGDTFVATSTAFVRPASKMVHNTVAVQTGRDPLTAKIAFRWRTGEDGAPASFFAGTARSTTGQATVCASAPVGRSSSSSRS